jgi:hypothetical protein
MSGESHLSALQPGNTVSTMDAALIEKEALNLTEPERALLADRLLQTLGGEDEEHLRRWVDEAESRWRAFRDGRLKVDDGDAVLARLRATVGG